MAPTGSRYPTGPSCRASTTNRRRAVPGDCARTFAAHAIEIPAVTIAAPNLICVRRLGNAVMPQTYANPYRWARKHPRIASGAPYDVGAGASSFRKNHWADEAETAGSGLN